MDGSDAESVREELLSSSVLLFYMRAALFTACSP